MDSEKVPARKIRSKAPHAILPNGTIFVAGGLNGGGITEMLDASGKVAIGQTGLT